MCLISCQTVTSGFLRRSSPQLDEWPSAAANQTFLFKARRDVCRARRALFMQAKLWLRMQPPASGVLVFLTLSNCPMCFTTSLSFRSNVNYIPPPQEVSFAHTPFILFLPAPLPFPLPHTLEQNADLSTYTYQVWFKPQQRDRATLFWKHKSNQMTIWHRAFFLPPPQDFKHTQSFMLWEADTGLWTRCQHWICLWALMRARDLPICADFNLRLVGWVMRSKSARLLYFLWLCCVGLSLTYEALMGLHALSLTLCFPRWWDDEMPIDFFFLFLDHPGTSWALARLSSLCRLDIFISYSHHYQRLNLRFICFEILNHHKEVGLEARWAAVFGLHKTNAAYLKSPAPASVFRNTGAHTRPPWSREQDPLQTVIILKPTPFHPNVPAWSLNIYTNTHIYIYLYLVPFYFVIFIYESFFVKNLPYLSVFIFLCHCQHLSRWSVCF